MIKTCHITTVDISLANLLANRLHLLKQYNYAVHTASAGGQHRSKLLNEGIPHHVIQNLTRRWDPLSDIKSIHEIHQFLRSYNFDIVNTYSPKAGIYGRIAASYAKVPIIVHTSWGLFFSEDAPIHKKIFHLSLEFLAGLHCDHIFSVNNDDIDLLIKYRIKDASKISYIGNGTDIDHFHPRYRNNAKKIKKQFGISSDRILVGIVARVVKEKGYAEFIKAAADLKNKFPNVDFLSIGPIDRDKPDSFSSRQIDEIERTGIVRFLGYQTDMRKVYSMLDIVVLPSYREGHPRSLVEACAMGLPIITTNTRGCKETVEDGYNGFLVPLKDSDSLVQKIAALLNNSCRRAIFGTNSRKKAERDYNQEKLVHRIAEVYQSLIESKKQ